MQNFVENFNIGSEDYLSFRPQYPKELFLWLNKITDDCKIALDCGTGNGQAAVSLVDYFDKIIAIDSNINQLHTSINHTKIEYKLMDVHNLKLPSNSIDLIISASAVHWFNLESFYNECKRVLKSSGKIVVWTYTWPTSDNLKVNNALKQILEILNPFWPKESILHLDKYENLEFPFTQFDTPLFTFHKYWNINQVLSFFSTWSCIKEYVKRHDSLFLEKSRELLMFSWDKHNKIKFNFTLYMKAGVK